MYTEIKLKVIRHQVSKILGSDNPSFRQMFIVSLTLGKLVDKKVSRIRRSEGGVFHPETLPFCPFLCIHSFILKGFVLCRRILKWTFIHNCTIKSWLLINWIITRRNLHVLNSLAPEFFMQKMWNPWSRKGNNKTNFDL